MLTSLQMSLQISMALTCLYLVMPSVLSMSLSKTIEDGPTKESFVIPMFSKRHISGADPWSLCPNSMERVDCFYEYLRVYARLRKAVEFSNNVSVRNIGKRTSYLTTSTQEQPAEDELRISDAYLMLALQDEENKEDESNGERAAF